MLTPYDLAQQAAERRRARASAGSHPLNGALLYVPNNDLRRRWLPRADAIALWQALGNAIEGNSPDQG